MIISARDMMVIAGIGFTLAITLLILHFSYTTISDNLLNTTQFNDSTYTRNAFIRGQELINRFDWVFFVGFISLIMVALITAWFVASHPVLSFIFFLVVVVTVCLSAVLSHAWYRIIITGPGFSDTLQYFPITNHVMGNLPMYMAIVGMALLVVVFSKPSLDGGGRG